MCGIYTFLCDDSSRIALLGQGMATTSGQEQGKAGREMGKVRQEMGAGGGHYGSQESYFKSLGSCPN